MTPQELRDWRKALDFTQENAARALGVTLRGYAKWEAGDAPISERVNLAAQMYLRRHRSTHGFNGAPLLYVVRVYESETNRTPAEYYLVVARDEHEAARLTYEEIGSPHRAHLAADAVADAPADATPRIIGTVESITRTSSLPETAAPPRRGSTGIFRRERSSGRSPS